MPETNDWPSQWKKKRIMAARACCGCAAVRPEQQFVQLGAQSWTALANAVGQLENMQHAVS